MTDSPEMTVQAVEQFIVVNKDKPEVAALMGKLATPLNVDGVKGFLEQHEDGKRFAQTLKDTHFTKSLETWKANNLQKIVDDEIAKKYPAESEDKKTLRKLQQDLEAEKSARIREGLKNKAITMATQKGLPLELVEHFVGQDEAATNVNLGLLETVWNGKIKEAVEAKFKGSGRQPHQGDSNQPPTTDLQKLEEQYQAAVKAGNLVAQISLKQRIHELRTQKKE